jgi:hypothetical protein
VSSGVRARRQVAGGHFFLAPVQLFFY